jgi:uncharacterized membrane protein (UPF0136 family)
MAVLDYTSLGISVLSIFLAIPGIVREKYFVRRDVAVINGVLLLINGLITFFLAKNSVLMLAVGIAVAGIGILAAFLTVQRDDTGTRIGSSLITVLLLVLLLVIQANESGVVNIF